MKMIRLLVAVLAVGAMTWFASALPAQEAPATPKEEPKGEEKPKEEPKQPEKKEEDKAAEEDYGAMFERVFKDLDKVTGKIELSEDDVKLALKHHEGVQKVFKGDKEFKKLQEKNLKEAFDYAVKNEKFLAWAKENSLDGERLVRISLRLMTIALKAQTKEQIKTGHETIEASRKQVEDAKADSGEETYKAQVKALDKNKKMLDQMSKAIDGIPGPTEAEAKLVKANEEAVQKMMESDDEDEEKEGDDGMGGKDEKPKEEKPKGKDEKGNN